MWLLCIGSRWVDNLYNSIVSDTSKSNQCCMFVIFVPNVLMVLCQEAIIPMAIAIIKVDVCLRAKSFVVIKPYIAANALVRTQHCSQGCLDARAPGQKCWQLNINWIGLISWKKLYSFWIAVKHEVEFKKYRVIEGLSELNKLSRSRPINWYYILYDSPTPYHPQLWTIFSGIGYCGIIKIDELCELWIWYIVKCDGQD